MSVEVDRARAAFADDGQVRETRLDGIWLQVEDLPKTLTARSYAANDSRPFAVDHLARGVKFIDAGVLPRWSTQAGAPASSVGAPRASSSASSEATL